MTEDDELKKIESETERAEKRVDKEIETENIRLRKELEELKKRQARLDKLKTESSGLEQLKPAKKEKITEVEIQVNFDSAKKVFRTLYNVFIQKRVLFYILLVIAIVIGVVIRSASLPALGASPLIGNGYLNMGGSLTGLDPYTFYIQMNTIIHTGTVPIINHIQYLPIGAVTRGDPLLISFFGAFLFRILTPIFPAATSMTWFMIYPVIVAALATVILFFICLELFGDYWIAALSGFMMPVFQTLLNRTTAGFSTKDAMGFLMILLAVYFLVKALKSKETRSKILYGFMVAFATALTADSSGFSKFLFFLVPLVYIIMILFNYVKKGDLYAFLPFALFIPILASFVTLTPDSLVTGAQYYAIYLCYAMVLFKLLIYDRYGNKLKIPFVNIGASIAIYSTIILVALLALAGKLSSIFSHLLSEIQSPLGISAANPVTQTIAEYGQTTLLDRMVDAGGLIGTGANAISINFLLLLLGGIFLLYYFLKGFKHWYLPFLAILPFLLLIFGGNYTTQGSGPTSVLLVFVFAAFIPLVWFGLNRKGANVKRSLTSIVFMTLVSLILLVSLFLAEQTTTYYEYGIFGIIIILLLAFFFDKLDEKTSHKSVYMVAFIFYILAMLFANLQNQLLESVGFIGIIVLPFAAVFIVTFVVKYVNNILKSSKKTAFAVSAIIILVAIIFLVVDLNNSLQASYLTSQGSGSGLALWGPTMLWINYNTPVNTSIISWWDYGYWEEAIANRTAVADGSNAYGYQSMIADYFFEATSPYQYSTYLNFIHNPTYAVISGSEVEKFSAISTIALNLTEFTPMAEDRPSANSNNIGNKDYQNLAIFGGSSSAGLGPIESNMVIDGVPWNSSVTILVEVLIPYNYTNSSFVQSQVVYGIVYNALTKQVSNPLPIENFCVFGVGCDRVTTNSSAIPGGIMILNDTNTVNLNMGGYAATGGYEVAPINTQIYGNGPGVLYLPEKSLDTLFVKLYLLNETVPGFTEIFTDGLPQDSLLSIGNQVLTNINVYAINYTALSQYNLLNQSDFCSVSPSAVDYCANLSYLPEVFSNNSELLASTPINASPTS